ncbi:MAG: DUF1638 domain-containing protein [Proteobacteria bacterium]|jgi:hypothetical protein|nr:DUF1638 domain-containing protein [Pseudomonadota bacterium]MBT4356572.1 DUF1638 domain-containing protein [Pseudomonadota bacterium]MBT4986410.1 DUF1638 domain-containing protein [Pseudomonadota bacterium]MBT5188516.1 DUF1638 domain-containing protein [Pseudomonadota bacterium]MBT5624281.1 DUF1638 domain-containing protein [Pseudomonadota bacterium]
MTLPANSASSLVIACGALAHEITALKRMSGWDHLVVACLPASLHNRPEQIATKVKQKIDESRDKYRSIFVAYADCGTGGMLDSVLEKEGIERLPGAHCYEFFMGSDQFEKCADQEPGTFYLTDFLAQHFERLIMVELGIRDHPELLEMYFSNYTKLIYLSQSDTPRFLAIARAAADTLELEFEHVVTGYGELRVGLSEFASDCAAN